MILNTLPVFYLPVFISILEKVTMHYLLHLNQSVQINRL